MYVTLYMEVLTDNIIILSTYLSNNVNIFVYLRCPFNFHKNENRKTLIDYKQRKLQKYHLYQQKKKSGKKAFFFVYET